MRRESHFYQRNNSQFPYTDVNEGSEFMDDEHVQLSSKIAALKQVSIQIEAIKITVYKESSNFAIYSSQDERNKSTTDQQLLSVSSPSNLIHLLTRENISPEQHIKAIEEQLISKDSKIPTYSSGETILHLAIRFNQIDVLKYFIDKYPEMLQVRDSYGRTVLHSACLRCPGNNELIYMLANRNDVDVDSFDNEGMTPLHHA
ncbi:hypothetical protein GJ496_010254 [Pomphorhynchus laevis]|nr:hypothetical protein GJ496_010254 [Pomphorhynchus laevis]